MTYNEAKKAIFASGSVPDGFNGDRAEVGFTFHPETGRTLVVAHCGWFTAPIPAAIDEAEALWLLNNHPSANHIIMN